MCLHDTYSKAGLDKHLSCTFKFSIQTGKNAPWFWPLLAGLSRRKPGFYTSPVHVRFVLDEVTMGQVFLQVLLLYPVSIIPQCYVISAIDSVANDDTPKKEYEGIRFILGQQRTNSPHVTAVTTVALSGTI